jgi:hypothetical protein
MTPLGRTSQFPGVRAGRSGIGATLSPERVPVKDCFAPIAVALRRTQDFPILILRLPAVRIFAGLMLIRKGERLQAGAHARVWELGR